MPNASALGTSLRPLSGPAGLPQSLPAEPTGDVQAPTVLPDRVFLRYAMAGLALWGAYTLANSTVSDFHAGLGTLGLLLVAGLLAHEVSVLLLGAATLAGGIWALVTGGAVIACVIAISIGGFLLFSAEFG